MVCDGGGESVFHLLLVAMISFLLLLLLLFVVVSEVQPIQELLSEVVDVLFEHQCDQLAVSHHELIFSNWHVPKVEVQPALHEVRVRLDILILVSFFNAALHAASEDVPSEEEFHLRALFQFLELRLATEETE